MDGSEHDVLAYMSFPAQQRAKLHSTNPLERLNEEMTRRADVVGIFPGEASIVGLIGVVLLEANDEWQLQHRYMQVEAMAELLPPSIEAEVPPATSTRITPEAACPIATSAQSQFPPSCQMRPPRLAASGSGGSPGNGRSRTAWRRRSSPSSRIAGVTASSGASSG